MIRTAPPTHARWLLLALLVFATGCPFLYVEEEPDAVVADDDDASDDDDTANDDDTPPDDDDTAPDDDDTASDDDDTAPDDDDTANDDDDTAPDDDDVTGDDDDAADADGDGYSAPEDCDDTDPSVHPGAPFTCVWSTLSPCSDPAVDAFTESAMNPPGWGSNAYVVPSEGARDDFAASVQAALDGDAAAAEASATDAGYSLCADGTVLLWSAPSGSGSAALALRTAPSAADLVVETPHSFFDIGTLAEGEVVFEQVGARALLASGTNRCASFLESSCAGSSQVCTLFEAPFRVSDMAHTEDSFFHAAHEVLAAGLPETVTLSLHRFLESGASVSNGTTDSTASDSPSALLTDALTDAFPGELITSCNDYGAGNDDPRVCGTALVHGSAS